MSAEVLLTGATGFIGTQIAMRLLNDTDHPITALVRAGDDEAAALRLSRSWWDWPELAQAIGGRVSVLRGDVSEPRLGLGEPEYHELVRSVTHIIHAAADLRIDAPIEEVRRTNVLGVANVIDLARAAHRDHGLGRLSHISTAYVSGTRRGIIPEGPPEEGYGFYNSYERSKNEGERLVQAASGELPVSVFRPGMVVGDSGTGYVKTFNTVYFLLRRYLNGRLRFVPTSPSTRVNLVPVDYVAGAVARLTFEQEAEGLTFHLTAPREMRPEARDLMGFVREWALEHIGVGLPDVAFLPWSMPLIGGLHRLRASRPGDGGFLGALVALAPYFDDGVDFSRENADRLLGPYDLSWEDFMPNLLAFAVYNGFLHRSGRTAHEQVIFRLRSRSLPVKYHDIVEGRIVARDTDRVRGEMLAAAGALRRMGVGKGDRVAIVGLNSTRYLTLDVAIGLAGAASVPIYYTSPPAEIDEILDGSGAKLLLVGAPRVLERLGELKAGIPVVDFCRKGPGKDLGRDLMTWGEFIAMGEASEENGAAPVGPGDLATVRYTSGTTGRVKGVCFDHGNLVFMAESLCSMLPWGARNSEASYLSFLPMNHVVEGIIGAYSPYYAPAPLKVYFLEDFRGLQGALPMVRPSVFFSVPRFYEKLWGALSDSWLGRLYLGAGDGLRGLLRPILRRTLLRRAGLDRCAQLIVGSAPSGGELLRGFHELGVEVHDAYGLTEAPLVTMNRLGENRLGTVGRPLPRTEVGIGGDGEVMVRGPQVMRGYLGSESDQPFRDGWLLTGDLGHITDEGSLVIHGRKKELIITSYGKNVHPGRVESMLREIQGVAEAMVVGEGRPYCSAIIWVDGGSQGKAAEIEEAVRGVNRGLSQPENVRRWAILENDLSIEGGDLTANLKLRRGRVLERLSGVVEALYGGPEPEAPGVIKIGGEGRE